MGALVDSDVLLDVLTEAEVWLEWSSGDLARAADAGPSYISPVIYAEVSVRFSRIEDPDDALPWADYERLALPWEAAFLAGKAFLSYRRNRGTRTSTLPDFFIGAHAAVGGLRLLTRLATHLDIGATSRPPRSQFHGDRAPFAEGGTEGSCRSVRPGEQPCRAGGSQVASAS